MSARPCEVCRKPFEAATARARYCGPTCRSRANRSGSSKPAVVKASAAARTNPAPAGGTVTPLHAVPAPAAAPPPARPVDDVPAGGVDVAGDLVATLTRELRDAGRLDTWQGQSALALAVRLEHSAADTGSAVASLTRELRAAVTEAMKGVGAQKSAVEKLRDDLKKRRERAGT